MRTLLILPLAGYMLQAAAPVVVDGPRVQYIQKNTFMVKWRTSEAPGASSKIGCNLPVNAAVTVDTCTVGAGDGAKFPAGAVVKIGRERLKVVSQSGDTLALLRSFDAEYERVWEGTLQSVAASAGACTVNTAEQHFYTVGDKVRVLRATGISDQTTYTVASIPSKTSFTFSCPGAANGLYNNGGLQVYMYPDAHAAGTAITRIDSTGQVCYGIDPPYTSTAVAPSLPALPQSINHFTYVMALRPGAVYHWKVQSTTGGSRAPTSCNTPGPDTGESSYYTTSTLAAAADDQIPAAPSMDGKNWDFTDAGIFATDVLAADCSDIQAQLNSAAAGDGNLNHRVQVPPSLNCNVNLTLPAKSGPNPSGTGKLVFETAAWASLPPQGISLNTNWHGGYLPVLYTSISSPVILVAPNASYWIVRGLNLQADPAKNSAAFGGDFPLITSFTGDSADYDVLKQPNHIAFDQMWVSCPDYNNYCKGFRLHGTYLAVMDSRVGPVYANDADQGAIQFDGFASQYLYVHNNDVSGAMSGYYQSDNSLNPKDSIIDRNYFHKPVQWNMKAAEYQFGAVQSVSSAAAGSQTTIVTTAQNDIANGTPVAFAGATGDWAALNYTSWSVRTGNMNITVSSGTATVTTSAAHGLTTGQYVSYGGGHVGPCGNFNSQGGAARVRVVDDSTFTFPTASANFSTVRGTACEAADISVYGPVFLPSVTGPDTFNIPLDSTGLGPLTGTVTAAYPRVRDIKNAFEFKTGIRSLVTGNIIDGSWSQSQSGQLFVATVRGADAFAGWPMAQGTICWACSLTISDVDIRNNVFRNGCSGLQILGVNPNGPVTPLYRLRAQGNLFQNLSGMAAGPGTCVATPMAWYGSYNDMTFDHNTTFNSSYAFADDSTTGFMSGKIYISNNIIAAAAPMSNGSCEWAGLLTGLNRNGCIPSFIEWSHSRNVFYGDAAAVGSLDPWNYARQYESGVTTGSAISYLANFWPTDQSGVGFANSSIVIGATNTSPIVVATRTAHGCARGDVVRVAGASGNTNANGLWVVGATTDTTLALAGSIGNGTLTGPASLVPWSGSCATLPGAALDPSSPYSAGTAYLPPDSPPNYGAAGRGTATDNTNIGADTAAIQAAIGVLQVSNVTPSSTGATFTYIAYAGSGETCYIDISSDSFNGFTRTPDTGIGTSRQTEVRGLAAGTTYSYRLMCPSDSASGTFTTGGADTFPASRPRSKR